MSPLRVLVFRCPGCERRTCLVVDMKTEVKARCADCDREMELLRARRQVDYSAPKTQKERPN